MSLVTAEKNNRKNRRNKSGFMGIVFIEAIMVFVVMLEDGNQ